MRRYPKIGQTTLSQLGAIKKSIVYTPILRCAGEGFNQCGMTIGYLTPVAMGATHSAISGVLTQWASSLDRQGKPATRALAAFIALNKQ